MNGKLGRLCFYKLGDQHVVRSIGRVGKERYARAPAFERMRQNMREFGVASMAAKDLRVAMAPMLAGYTDPYVSARLTAAMLNVLKQDIGPAGQRTLNLPTNGASLEGFAFTRSAETPLTLFNIMCNEPRNTVYAHVSQFSPEKLLHIPAGSTHFQLVVGVAALGTYAYDAASGCYQRPGSPHRGLFGMKKTPIWPIDEDLPSTLLPVVLPNVVELPADEALVVSSGVQFCGALSTGLSRSSMEIARFIP
ncbi:MAG: hypothetical protein R2813_11920 [Flavobacteriales bacterium]